MAHSIIELTTGPPGTGKSYCRVSLFLVTQFLPDRSGRFYTNVNLGRVPQDHPFKPEPWTDAQGRTRNHTSFIRRICNEAAKRYGGDPNDYAKRVRRIPPRVSESWRLATSGPWDYFEKFDLSASHIQIDEIHNSCPKDGSRKRPLLWQQWLGEIRHRGCTVEFMTQDLAKVNPKLLNEIALRRTMTDTATLRDPWFHIPVGDWLEVKALILGYYDRATYVTEKIRIDERWKVNHSFKFRFKPEFFAFYNSHEKPQKGGKAGKEDKHQFEKRTKRGLLWWFVKRHPWPLISRFAVVCAVCWLVFFGGSEKCFAFVMDSFSKGLGGTVQADQQPAPTAEDPPQQLQDEPQAEPQPAEQNEDEQAAQTYEAPAEPTTDEATQIAQLQAQVDALAAAREKALRQADELAKRRRAGSAVVMITLREVTFRDGYAYRVGEVIDYGEYVGRSVETINYKRRVVTLDDGTILRMGRDDLGDDGLPATTDASADGAGPAIVPDAVQPAETSGTDER